MGTRLVFSAALVLLLFAGLLRAAEPAAAPSPAGQEASPQQLAQDLDAAEFAQRQEASQKLQEAGKAVFPELEKAAEQGSREASGRAIEILQQHFQRGDDETKQVARAALERLTKSGNSGAAQRANLVLNPPPEVQGRPVGVFGMPGIQRANIQIQVGANNFNGNVRRVHIRNENGKRTIEVEENGKKTKVQDGANGGIEVEITKKVNDKETTEKFQAKDLDDLRKKDPEAARVYEQAQQAGQNGNGVQIQAGGIQIGQPGQNNQIPKELVERMVKSLDERIKQLEGQQAGNPAAQRLLDSLKQRKQQYEQMLPAAKPAENK